MNIHCIYASQSILNQTELKPEAEQSAYVESDVARRE